MRLYRLVARFRPPLYMLTAKLRILRVQDAKLLNGLTHLLSTFFKWSDKWPKSTLNGKRLQRLGAHLFGEFITYCRGTVGFQRAHGSDWGAGTYIGPVYHPVPPVPVFFPVRTFKVFYYTSANYSSVFGAQYYYFF